jgi:CrcB protein
MHHQTPEHAEPIDEADPAWPALGDQEAAPELVAAAAIRPSAVESHIRMLTIVLIALGAAIGATGRFFLAQWAAERFGTSFPYGTLIINITGSFLLGFVYALLTRASPTTGQLARAFLGIGLLGGYTTFSSFSYETSQLLLRGDLLGALVNPLASVLGGIVVCVLGIALGSLVVGAP